MTTGLEVKIFRALTDRLDTLATAQSLSVAKPGLPFTPASNTPYLKVWHMPSSTEALTVAGDVNEYRGTFQVSVFYPAERGLVAPYELASLVADHFATGTELSHEGVSFSVLAPPHIGPALDEPGWVMLPVSIRFRAFLAP